MADETESRRHFRAQRRVEAQRQVTVRRGDWEGGASTKDLSEAGALLSGAEVLPAGETLLLTLELGEGEPSLTVQAEVRWSDPEQQAMGVRFVNLKPHEKRRLQSAVAEPDELAVFELFADE